MFKAGLLLAITCLVAISLTGCGIKFLPLESADFPVAIQKDRDTISAVVCRQVEADQVLVQVRGPEGGNWSTIYGATGHGQYSPNDDLFQTSRSQGMAISGPEIIDPKEVTQVMILVDAPDSSFTSIFFSLKGFSDDSWLHPDGSTSAVPCPGK